MRLSSSSRPSTVPEGLAETFELDNVRDGTVKVNLAPDQDRVDVDFGFPPGPTPTGSIGDFIFLDANGDGNQTGDKGISGVTVELIQDGKVIATTVTGEDGLYNFDKLPVGEYTVQVSTVLKVLLEHLKWTKCMMVVSK